MNTIVVPNPLRFTGEGPTTVPRGSLKSSGWGTVGGLERSNPFSHYKEHPLLASIKLERNIGSILRSLDAIKNGEKPITPDELDESLECAIQFDFEEAVKAIIDDNPGSLEKEIRVYRRNTSDIRDRHGEKVSLDVQSEAKGSPLLIAACYANVSIIRMLVNMGANINAESSTLTTTPINVNVIDILVDMAKYKSDDKKAEILELIGDLCLRGTVVSKISTQTSDSSIRKILSKCPTVHVPNPLRILNKGGRRTRRRPGRKARKNKARKTKSRR
jgi:hypothetical protein